MKLYTCKVLEFVNGCLPALHMEVPLNMVDKAPAAGIRVRMGSKKVKHFVMRFGFGHFVPKTPDGTNIITQLPRKIKPIIVGFQLIFLIKRAGEDPFNRKKCATPFAEEFITGLQLFKRRFNMSFFIVPNLMSYDRVKLIIILAFLQHGGGDKYFAAHSVCVYHTRVV